MALWDKRLGESFYVARLPETCIINLTSVLNGFSDHFVQGGDAIGGDAHPKIS